MGIRFAVVYGLMIGPARDLTTNASVTHVTTDNRERAEEIAAALNTPEGIMRLHAEIAAKPEYAGVDQIHTTPAEVVELPE